MKTTLYDLLQELQTWIPTSPPKLTEAELSKIDEGNNKEFKALLKGWVSGYYDESPEQLHSSLMNLVPELTIAPMEILDSLGGHITGNYEKDSKRALKLKRVFAEKDYLRAYQLDAQP